MNTSSTIHHCISMFLGNHLNHDLSYLRTSNIQWKELLYQLYILSCISTIWNKSINKLYNFNKLIEQLKNEPINAMCMAHAFDTNTTRICNIINIALLKKQNDRIEWNRIKRIIACKNQCTNCNMLLYSGDESCIHCRYRLLRSCSICYCNN